MTGAKQEEADALLREWAERYRNVPKWSATRDMQVLLDTRAYLARRPEPVDPVVLAARELIADAVAYGKSLWADPVSPLPQEFRDGGCDQGDLIQRAIKLAREPRS